MKEILLKKEYEITCLSPVHIGSGETLEQTEYIYDRQKRRVGFLDQAKFRQLLCTQKVKPADRQAEDDWRSKLRNMAGGGNSGEGTLLDDLCADISNRRTGSLNDWLLRKGISQEKINSLVTHWAKGNVEKDKKNLNQIMRHISQPDGRLYIPGSSLKGAFRTAVLYSMLSEFVKRSFYQGKIQQILKNNSRQTKSELKKAGDCLENELVSVLDINDKNGNPVNNQLRSAFRGLRVSDANIVGDIPESVIIQKTDRFSDGADNQISIFRECLPKGTKLRFSVTIEPAMMKEIDVYDFEDIIANMESFTTENVRLLKKAFPHEEKILKEAEAATLILGGGTGFLTKTLWYELFDNFGVAKNLLAKYFDMVFQKNRRPAHNHGQKDITLAPRTLKVAKTGGEVQLLGLCAVTEVPSC